MKIYQRDPEELTKAEAVFALRSIREILWPTHDVAAQWSSDEIADIASILHNARLSPTPEALHQAEAVHDLG